MTWTRTAFALGLVATLAGTGTVLDHARSAGGSAPSAARPEDGRGSWLGSEDAARRTCVRNMKFLRGALEMKALDHGSFPQPLLLQEGPGDAEVLSMSFRGVPPADLREEGYLLERELLVCPSGGTYAAFAHPPEPLALCTRHGLAVGRLPLAPPTPRAGGLHAGGRNFWIGDGLVLMEEEGTLFSFMDGLAAYLEGPERPEDRLVVTLEVSDGERSLVYTMRAHDLETVSWVEEVPLSTFPDSDAVAAVVERHLTRLDRGAIPHDPGG